MKLLRSVLLSHNSIPSLSIWMIKSIIVSFFNLNFELKWINNYDSVTDYYKKNFNKEKENENNVCSNIQSREETETREEDQKRPQSSDKSRLMESTLSYKQKKVILTGEESDYLKQKNDLTFKPKTTIM